MQAVTETTKAATIAVKEADNPVNNVRLIYIIPKSGGPAMYTTKI